MASEGGVKEADPRDHVFGFGRRCVLPLYLMANLDFTQAEPCQSDLPVVTCTQNLSRYSA